MTREQFAPGSAPLVRDRDREIVSTATGNRTGLVLDSDATGGAVSVLSVYLPQGANGAAPHLHTRSTELFYVVSGRLEILAGDRIEILEQGDTLLIPRLMPHAFGATGNSDVNVLTVLSPVCSASTTSGYWTESCTSRPISASYRRPRRPMTTTLSRALCGHRGGGSRRWTPGSHGASATALIRFRVSRMPLQLVRPRAQPSNAQ